MIASKCLHSFTFQSLAVKIGVNVDFQKWSGNPILQFYKGADVFLLTSEFEGYGMTLIEAAAAGCPVVTTKVGIAKTDLFKNGINSYVCPVGDVDCLAESVVGLIKNPERLESFRNKMREDIKTQIISKEEYQEKYVSLLESLIK